MKREKNNKMKHTQTHSSLSNNISLVNGKNFLFVLEKKRQASYYLIKLQLKKKFLTNKIQHIHSHKHIDGCA